MSLLTAAGAPAQLRAYIYAETGMGKSHLMRNIARQVKGGCRSLSIPEMPAGQYADLLSELATLSFDTGLLILDDIDHAQLAHAEETRVALARRPHLSIYVTSSSREIHKSWYHALGEPERYVTLPLWDFPEGRALLASRGWMGKAAEAALGECEGNPGRLVAWAEARESGLLDPDDSGLATILSPDGQRLAPGDRGFHRVELAVQEVSDRLIKALAERPELMYELSSRKFEETVAELYAKAGYKVELTRPSRDGGVDFYALQKTPFGSFLTVVDCKRYRPDRPVEVGLVKSLYGTTVATKASAGVIATTSYFTAGAKTFQEEREHRIGLQDFVSLKEMLEQAAREAPERDPADYESD